MKIMLVMPNYREIADEDSLYPTEANGIACLASFIREKGYEVKILDAATYRYSAEQVAEYILKDKFDYVGFSVYQSAYEYTKQVVRIVRERGYDGHISIGGHFPTFQYKEIFEDLEEIDSICIGEGELAVWELIKRIEKGQDIRSIMGVITYDKEKKKVIENKAMPLIKDLSSLPWQSRETLGDILNENNGIASMLSSRGCYGRCSYCSINAFYSLCDGELWRGRDYQDVINEMEAITLKYDVKLITFYDDNFIGPKNIGVERAYKFAEEKIRRDIEVPFAISCRANDVDRELFVKLKEAGLKIVYLGIEAMNDRILKVYNKGITKETNYEALKILEDLGIESKIGFILFEPEINIDELKENVEFLKGYVNRKNSSTFYFLKSLRIYAGTDMQTYYGDKGILEKIGFEYIYEFQDENIKDLLEFLKKIILIMPDMISKTKGIMEENLKPVEVSIANWYLNLILDWIGIRKKYGERKKVLEFNLISEYKEKSKEIYALIEKLKWSEEQNGKRYGSY